MNINICMGSRSKKIWGLNPVTMLTILENGNPTKSTVVKMCLVITFILTFITGFHDKSMDNV